MSIESIRQRLDAATPGPDLIAHAPTDLALLLEVAEAAREARDSTGVEYADERLRYAVLQIDREDWTRLMAALDALEAAE